MGSEMCIRDRPTGLRHAQAAACDGLGARGGRDAAGTSARTRASVQTALRAPAWPATTGALLLAGAAAAVLVHQRWTMLLLLMLAFAYLFVPGLLLLQMMKA